ncbi:MAG: hypothetical protein ACREP9_15185, partial [Candidatus Dormibacteraceae bacterium]
PYPWEPKGTTRASAPWVAFLGYQIRFDALLRIRPSSLGKHLKLQLTEADTVIRAMREGVRRDAPRQFPTRVVSGYLCRIKAIATPGLVRGELRRGWCSGFRLLRGNPHVQSQLRALDRGLGRQVARLKRSIAALTGLAAPALLLRGFRRFSTSYAAQMEGRNDPRSQP